MPDRAVQSSRFLDRAGWSSARRRFLAGDASARRYERLSQRGATAVLMDAPPGQGEEIEPFVRIAGHLSALGLSAPEILAKDEVQGFLLLEDLGDGLFAALSERDPKLQPVLYESAVDVLVRLQSAPPLPGLPNATAAGWALATDVALNWYRFAATGDRLNPAPLCEAVEEVLEGLADGPRVMILRDYHAENLLWLPARQGIARVGLLDFQLAQMGQPGYDLVSLCQDARRDVPDRIETAMVRHFMDATGAEARRFLPAYAALGAQRALRILGVFARLCLVAGKPGYVALIPRVWNQLQRNLAHPALSRLSATCADLLPEPTPERLERITGQCASPDR